MPEGLAVALALLALGYSRWQAIGVAALTGLVDPIGASSAPLR
jgi:ZIP family zinc transporter